MAAVEFEEPFGLAVSKMELDCVDVYYVHNPESQLGSVPEEEFYARLRAAFESLEQSRTRGQLKFYGVATWNGFRVPAGSSGYHSLSRMVAIARELAGESHGFRFIQLPFNLAMPQALTLSNPVVNGQQISTLGAAGALAVTV